MMRMYDETIQHSTFNIAACRNHSTFNTQHSTFNIAACRNHSTFHIQHSTFNILLLRSMHFMELVDVSAFHFKLILS